MTSVWFLSVCFSLSFLFFLLFFCYLFSNLLTILIKSYDLKYSSCVKIAVKITSVYVLFLFFGFCSLFIGENDLIGTIISIYYHHQSPVWLSVVKLESSEYIETCKSVCAALIAAECIGCLLLIPWVRFCSGSMY